MQSNNVNTFQFNGRFLIVYNVGIVPEYISSYDARKFSFPEFMAIRKFGKNGKPYEKKQNIICNQKNQFVLFGGYMWDIDKKTLIQGKSCRDISRYTLAFR